MMPTLGGEAASLFTSTGVDVRHCGDDRRRRFDGGRLLRGPAGVARWVR